MAAIQTFFRMNFMATVRANLRAGALKKPAILMLGKSSLTLHKTARIVSGGGRFTFNKVWYGRNYEGGYLCLQEGSTLKFSGMCNIYRAPDISVHKGAMLELDDVNINNNAEIHCSSHIFIGRGTMIGEGVRIRDSAEHRIARANEAGGAPTAPIHIGCHVLIGTGVTILKGVTIGDGAVIGAGSVVTKDVPARAMAAGIPARVIAENITWGPIENNGGAVCYR